MWCDNCEDHGDFRWRSRIYEKQTINQTKTWFVWNARSYFISVFYGSLTWTFQLSVRAMTLPTAIKDPVNIGSLVLLCFFFLLFPLRLLLLLFLPRRQPLQHISAAGQCNASTPDVFPFSEFWEWCVCNHGSDPFSARKEVDVVQSLSMAPCGLREVSADFFPPSDTIGSVSPRYCCIVSLYKQSWYICSVVFLHNLGIFFFFSIAKAMQKKPKKEQKCNTLLTSPNPLFPPLSQCDLLSEIRSVKQLHCAERLMENVYINRIFCIIIIIIECCQVFWAPTHVIYKHTESPSF